MKGILKKLLKNKVKKSLKENGSKPLFSPLLKYAIFGGSGFTFFLLGFIALCVIVFAPVFLAEEYFGSDNKVAAYDYCGETCGENESKFYSKLESVIESYKSKGVTIDSNLITGTVFYGSSLNNESFDPNEMDSDDLIDDSNIHVSDVKVLASNMVSGSSLDYNKYRSYLVSTYIPKRFGSLYTDDRGIERIADEIMSYASYEGTDIAMANSIGISCPEITMKDKDGSLKPLKLEDYVAGVVTAENGGAGDEAKKMQAIAARTNAVSHCDSVIDNSTNFQVYTTPSESGVAAAQATEGLVLTYQGELLKEMPFASYPRSNYRGGFPGYEASGYVCSNVDCNTGTDGRTWCETTLYRVPNMESFQLKMPDTTKSGSLWNGLHLNNQQGHCYGVSQVATMYYENELNYTHEQMIETFFSQGVEISAMGSGFSGATGNTDGTDFLPYELERFLGEKGTTIAAFNSSIKQAVVTAGPGTREGVVAAANALINGLSQYGVKLPYISSTGASGTASGKYEGYGAAPDWGKNGSWYSGYYRRTYYQAGLDCSGLVSWAIHNGGYKYEGLNSGGFLSHVGTSHSFASFRGKPGDLVVKDGHIGLILDVTDTEYIVAEEHGGENGLEVTHYTFGNPKGQFTHILDMTEYYSNSANMDLAYYQGG